MNVVSLKSKAFVMLKRFALDGSNLLFVIIMLLLTIQKSSNMIVYDDSFLKASNLLGGMAISHINKMYKSFRLSSISVSLDNDGTDTDDNYSDCLGCEFTG